MSKGVPVVREHQNFLELAACADCQFKDILFCFGSNALKVANGIPD